MTKPQPDLQLIDRWEVIRMLGISPAVLSSPRRPSSAIRIFSLGECCFWLARLMSLTRRLLH